jgi:hypothetical protein
MERPPTVSPATVISRPRPSCFMAPRAPDTANTAIEEQLEERLLGLETYRRADVLAYCGPIFQHLDDEIRDAVEHLAGGKRRRRPRLCVMLETLGGYIEVAERIANTFRRHYKYVEFLVPSEAMSAGTVLVLSGDEIYMDYYSTLGPIDPQVRKGDRWVPATGYIEQYERLVEKSRNGSMTQAELAFLVENFDPAELFLFEQARELSIRLLQDWLVRYKFRNWRVTETRKKKVTLAMKKARAKEVAEKLNNVDFWHSHARGLSLEVLRRKVGLRIKDFGVERDFDERVKSYHRLLTDYMRKTDKRIVIHTRGRYVAI